MLAYRPWLSSLSKKTVRRAVARPELVCLEDRWTPANFTVTTVADDGAGSLREAVQKASANAEDDTISFDFTVAGQKIALLSPITVTDTKVIDIAAGGQTIDGGGAKQLFSVTAGSNLKLSSLSLTGGKAADGGAIENKGTLTIKEITFDGNQATNDGGAIRNYGTLTVIESKFSNNQAGQSGGAVANAGDGAVFVLKQSTIGERLAFGPPDVTKPGNTAANGGGVFNGTGAKFFAINSTIHKNTATALGGGVQNVSAQFAKFTNSTIAFNTGGGVNTGTGGVTVLNNTIAIGNTTGDLTGDPVGTSKNNIVGDDTKAGGLVNNTAGNLVGVADAKTVLGTFFTNFGTQWYEPTKGGPAIDKGDNSLAVDEAGTKLTSDQNPGTGRFLADPGGVVDIGSRELNILPPVTIGGFPTSFNTPQDTKLENAFNTIVVTSDDSTTPLLITFTATKGTFTIPDTIADVTGITGSGTGKISFTAQNDGGAQGAVVKINYVPPAGVSFPQAAGETITITAKNTTTNDVKTLSSPLIVGAAGAAAALVGVPLYAVGSDAGGPATVQFFNADKTARLIDPLTPFGDFTGGVRTAGADFNNDGVADIVAGTGPGRATRVVVIDGANQKELFATDPFEASFKGGVYVSAGDLDGDGVADLIITPDEGGGPRVDVYSGKTFGKAASFFGIDDTNFRGGARAATGDLNGDGRADLIVVAGFGGGPRVAAFNGKSLGGTPSRVFGDFFAFEQTLRNGIFVTAGDLNGDGFADLICGGGPGGGPRVLAFSGKDLTAAGAQTQTQLANFFGGDPNSRGGIRLAVKDLDGDTRADLVVGAGAKAGSRVTSYLGKNIPTDGPPAENYAFDAVAGFTGGVFVG